MLFMDRLSKLLGLNAPEKQTEASQVDQSPPLQVKDWLEIANGEVQFKQSVVMGTRLYTDYLESFENFATEQACIDGIGSDLWMRLGYYPRRDLYEWLNAVMFRPKADKDVEPYIKQWLTMSAFVYGFKLPVALLSTDVKYQQALGMLCSLRKFEINIEDLRRGKYYIYEDTNEDEFSLIDENYSGIVRIIGLYNTERPQSLERIVQLMRLHKSSACFTDNPHTLGVGITLVAALTGLAIPRQWVRFTRSSASHLITHVSVDSSVASTISAIKLATAGE